MPSQLPPSLEPPSLAPHIDGGAAVGAAAAPPPDLIRWRQKERSGLAMADVGSRAGVSFLEAVQLEIELERAREVVETGLE